MAANASRAGGPGTVGDGCIDEQERRGRRPGPAGRRAGALFVSAGEHRTPGGPRIIFVVFLPFGCGYYLSYLYRTVNAVISENLATELGIGPADLGLLTSIYLIAFASSQIPLGVALDRYGPRRTNAGLLMFAAAGAAVFAVAEGFVPLLIGRALIGLGVSAALMGSFKANAMWFPADRLPLMNNLTGAFGAVGAISATRPVEMLLDVAGWRDIFAGLAVATVAASLAIMLLVPERRSPAPAGETFARQLSGFADVVRDPFFWRVTLLYSAAYATFVSYQTLWADPWLRDVAGLDQTARANQLLTLQVCFLLGLLVSGVLADRLRKTPIQAVHVFAAGLLLLALLEVPLALGVTSATAVIWGSLGFLSSAAYLTYAVLTARFPESLTGRAMTATNFFMFVVAFAAQWGIGAIIEAFPLQPDGGYSARGHAVALWVMIAIQLACFLNFVRPAARGRRRA